MKALALKFYNEGYNCSQCIIKAFQEKYDYPISDDVYLGLIAVNTGMGIGSFCSALVAAVMIFGFVFDKETAVRARLKLISCFDAYFGSLNCSGLNASKNKYKGCEKVISMAAYFTERILREEGFSQARG